MSQSGSAVPIPSFEEFSNNADLKFITSEVWCPWLQEGVLASSWSEPCQFLAIELWCQHFFNVHWTPSCGWVSCLSACVAGFDSCPCHAFFLNLRQCYCSCCHCSHFCVMASASDTTVGHGWRACWFQRNEPSNAVMLKGSILALPCAWWGISSV